MTIKLTHSEYAPSKDLLEGKIILITGAGSGIGKSAAITFANYGAQVILLSKNADKLADVYDEIMSLKTEQQIHEPVICPLDLLNASEENYEELASSIATQFGHLDGVLNNASLLGDLCEIENYPKGIWDQVMQVNLTAAFMLSKACLALLKKSKQASLIFTTSSVGRAGRAYWGAYGVSKFATEGLMQTLAQELENTSSVRVNCINPGGTRTQMRASAFPAEDPGILPTPEDIMPTYLYLMGDDSKNINGESIDVRAK